MSLNTALMLVYLTAFQLCALPAIVRIIRRQSSQDLSVWREWLLVLGASVQLAVMLRTGADWRVCVSPVATLISVAILLFVIRKYRTG